MFLTGMVGDEESLPKSGVLTSPNYPERYPNSHDSTQTIQVAEGKIIRITFIEFNTESDRDYVEIVDDDGTNLTPLFLYLPKLWGTRKTAFGTKPGVFTSNSNIVHVKFHTDYSGQRAGWRLAWYER